MPIARVHFYRCAQDAQEYGSNNEFMVSRVFFDLFIDGAHIGAFGADLKQTVASDFERGQIEVSPPQGYDGPWNHEAFADAARAYFRELVGAQGRGIRIQGGTNIRMRGNLSQMEKNISFEVSR